MNSFRLPYSLCVATLLAITGAGVMSATLVSYNTLPAWEAATSAGYGLIDFEVSAGASDYSNATGYQVSGLQFLGMTDGAPAYRLYIIDTVVNPGHSYDSGDVLKGPNYSAGGLNPRIRVVLPAGITSFGVDLMSYNGDGGIAGPKSYKVRLGSGDSWSGVSTLTQPGRQFFGATSTAPITSVEFILEGTPTNTYTLIDNFRFGTVAVSGSETPEPGTYLLVGSGLLAAGLYRRRRPAA